MNADRIKELLLQASANTNIPIPLALPLAVEREFARLIAADERESAAKRLDEAAARLTSTKRPNQVDRHMADVLENHATGIRTSGEMAWLAIA